MTFQAAFGVLGFNNDPMKIQWHSHNEDQTAELARTLAGVLQAGDVVALSGPLGAGKTTFVRALACAMGADVRLVSSPTFVLVNEYPTESGFPLVHMDAYRLGGADDLDALGWDQYVGPDAQPCVLVVEWAERIGDELGPEAAELRITPTGETDREFVLAVPESWQDRANLPEPSSDHGPFPDKRSQMADLYKWFSGQYTISRDLTDADFDEPGP